MKKIAFIGAGSLQFTSSCVRDLLTFPAFRETEFRLMDTNEANLRGITKVVQRILKEMDCPNSKIVATMDRAEALSGADGVLCTVFAGDIDIWQHDILIPKKYGVDISGMVKMIDIDVSTFITLFKLLLIIIGTGIQKVPAWQELTLPPSRD